MINTPPFTPSINKANTTNLLSPLAEQGETTLAAFTELLSQTQQNKAQPYTEIDPIKPGLNNKAQDLSEATINIEQQELKKPTEYNQDEYALSLIKDMQTQEENLNDFQQFNLEIQAFPVYQQQEAAEATASKNELKTELNPEEQNEFILASLIKQPTTLADVIENTEIEYEQKDQFLMTKEDDLKTKMPTKIDSPSTDITTRHPSPYIEKEHSDSKEQTLETIKKPEINLDAAQPVTFSNRLPPTNPIPNSVNQIVNQVSTYMNQALSAAQNEQTSDTLTKEPIALTQVIQDKIEQIESKLIQQSPYHFKIDNYQAKLKVYPQDLGEIQAEITLDPRGTALTLSTEHPEVRQWIEHHLQGLRDAFQDANIPLLDVNFQNTSDKKHNQDEQSRQAQQHNPSTADKQTQEQIVKKNKQTMQQTLVDTYA